MLNRVQSDETIVVCPMIGRSGGVESRTDTMLWAMGRLGQQGANSLDSKKHTFQGQSIAT